MQTKIRHHIRRLLAKCALFGASAVFSAAVSLEGVAQSNERVSEFLRNLQDSPLFAKQPQLEQTLAQEVPLSNKSKSRAYGFKMVLTLKKPEKPESQKAVSGKPAQSPASASASK